MEDYELGGSVWLAVRCYITCIVDSLPGAIPSRFNHILSDLQVKYKSSKPNPKMVLWKKLPTGWFKLSVYGSYKGNSVTYSRGGIIQDADENLKAAFWKKLDDVIDNGAVL